MVRSPKRGSGAAGYEEYCRLRSSTSETSAMADVQNRADMEALMTRLIQTEQAVLDTQQQVAASREAAPLVDTRTIATRQHSLVSTRTGRIGHSNSRHTWVLRIRSQSKHCSRQRWMRTISQPKR